MKPKFVPDLEAQPYEVSRGLLVTPVTLAVCREGQEFVELRIVGPDRTQTVIVNLAELRAALRRGQKGV